MRECLSRGIGGKVWSGVHFLGGHRVTKVISESGSSRRDQGDRVRVSGGKRDTRLRSSGLGGLQGLGSSKVRGRSALGGTREALVNDISSHGVRYPALSNKVLSNTRNEMRTDEVESSDATVLVESMG